MKSRVFVFNSVILVLITAFFTWFLSNDIFLGDDISEIINSVSDTAKFNIDGFFTSFVTKIFCVNLPLLLHIHPHQFSMTFGAFVRAFNIALLCGIISSFLFIGREKKSYLWMGTAFCAYYFCYASSNLSVAFGNLFELPRFEAEGSFFVLTEYTHHFGQILSLIFGLLFVLLLVSSFINQKSVAKKYIIPCCILGFLSGSSSMYVSVVGGILCTFVGIYYLALIFILNKTAFAEFIKSDKTVFLLVLSFFLGMVFFAFYPEYSFVQNGDILNSLKIAVKALISTVPLEIATVLILGTALYFMALHKTSRIKRTIFSALGILAGIFVYLLMFSSEGKNLTVSLAESFIVIRLTLLAVIFMITGVCITELETEPKVRKILLTIIMVVYGLFSLVQLPFVFTTMCLWKVLNQENTSTLYCIEKIYRFYSLSGKTAAFPEDSLMRIMKIDCFLNDKAVKDETITADTLFKDTDFTTGYYRKFYKNPVIVPYKFIATDSAIREFRNLGGDLAKEEFEKPNFQKLYDDDFVLNKVKKQN